MTPTRTDSPATPADRVRIFHGPRIETLTDERPGALATCAGRVVGTGHVADLLAAHPGAEVLHLDGELLVPGFNDAHLHPLFAAEPALRVDLRPEVISDRDHAVQVLRERAARTPVGEWVVGAGYDVLHPIGGRLDRSSLDEVSADHPVFVIGSTWHASIASSRALDLIRSHGNPDAPGGWFTRSADGELDGWLYELPHMRVAWSGTREPDLLPRVPHAALVEALVSQNRYLNARGITSYTDALVTPRTWRAYDALRAQGRQTARASLALWHTYRDVLDELPMSGDTGDEWLRSAGVKLMYDGALSGGTCLCSDPYQGPTGEGTGIQVLSSEELVEIVRDLHGRGIRVLAHANGDAAISDVLDAIELAQREEPRPGLEHRIEHCSITDDRALERIAAARVIPVPFAAFIHHHGDSIVRMYSEERAGRVARHGSMLRAGIPVAGSSDWPCGPVDVLRALHALTTRTTTDGRVIGADECLSLREALWVYTVGSARATGEHELKGRLAVGQLADFVVLSEDVFSAGAEWVESTEVVSTWVAGECVHGEASTT